MALEPLITQLQSADRLLRQHWEETLAIWQDDGSKRFAKDYLDPLSTDYRRVLNELQQLDQVIIEAQRVLQS